MTKAILGIVAALAAWLIVASAAGLILRAAWPEYVSVAATMRFTLPMQIARLAVGALATLAAGYIAAVVSRSRVAAIAGALLLLLFIPQHIMLWDKFPVWYHLTFLLSLVPLTHAGGRIAAPGRAIAPANA